MSNRYMGLVTMIVLLSVPMGGVLAQTAAPAKTLVVAGHSGQAPVVRINGKTYVDVESVARLTGGTLSFQANQTTLTLPAAPASPQPAPAPAAASRVFGGVFEGWD